MQWRGEQGRVADVWGARGRFWANTRGAKAGLDGGTARGWPEDGAPRRDGGDGSFVNNSKFQSPLCKLGFSPSSWP